MSSREIKTSLILLGVVHNFLCLFGFLTIQEAAVQLHSTHKPYALPLRFEHLNISRFCYFHDYFTFKFRSIIPYVFC